MIDFIESFEFSAYGSFAWLILFCVIYTWWSLMYKFGLYLRKRFITK